MNVLRPPLWRTFHHAIDSVTFSQVPIETPGNPVQHMRWTKLIDRNSLPIYEYDVVEVLSGNTPDAPLVVAEWLDERFACIALREPFWSESRQIYVKQLPQAGQADRVTVLGNIYEHPWIYET